MHLISGLKTKLAFTGAHIQMEIYRYKKNQVDEKMVS